MVEQEMHVVKTVKNRIIILPDEVSNKTDSGFILPDEAKQPPMYGSVVDAGPDCKYVKNGDKIIFPKGYGSKLDINKVEHIIMSEEDAFCVIEYK